MMHNPPHPGLILAGWINELGLSVSDFARHIGISRAMLSRVLNGHSRVSADMDIRLSEALGTSPGFWLRMQTARDLWESAERAKERARIEPLRKAA